MEVPLQCVHTFLNDYVTRLLLKGVSYDMILRLRTQSTRLKHVESSIAESLLNLFFFNSSNTAQGKLNHFQNEYLICF